MVLTCNCIVRVCCIYIQQKTFAFTGRKDVPKSGSQQVVINNMIVTSLRISQCQKLIRILALIVCAAEDISDGTDAHTQGSYLTFSTPSPQEGVPKSGSQQVVIGNIIVTSPLISQ